jgi:hypothetical protein
MDKGAIAFLDILGFKGIWQNREPHEVIDILDSVAPRVAQTFQKNLQGQTLPFKMESPVVTILSDTIVIVLKSDHPSCIAIRSSAILDLFDFFAQHRLFFRGAISYGHYIQKGSTFIGPAIDDVAEWYNVADWIGVISTPKTSYRIDGFAALKLVLREIGNKDIPCFIKYQVPAKAEPLYFSLNSLNWPAYFETRLAGVPDGVCGTLKTMRDFFADQAPFNAAVFQKFENTLRFVEVWYENCGHNSQRKSLLR